MSNPLAPHPGDDALLESLLADEARVRGQVVLLNALADGTFDRYCTGREALLKGAAETIRVLFNGAREKQAVHG